MATTVKVESKSISHSENRTMPRWLRRTLHRIPIYLVLVPLAILTVMPLIYMFSQALTPEANVYDWPIKLIPDNPTFENFIKLATWPNLPVMRWMFNSFFVSTAVTILILFINSLTAYAFARLEFPGREFLFVLVLTTIMIPGEVTLIPTFLIMRDLGWLDTYNALIWPAGASVFGVFLLRQFFQSIPRELEDAAIIDGCTKFGTYWRIIVPLSTSALIALAIFTFLGSWNDLFWPLIALNSNEMRTLPVGLSILQHEGYTMQGLSMAAAAVTTIPVLILYIIFQRHIIQGVMVSGLTGR
ncbi:carbohydrate ABC transporter permease [Chloroflexi bacterium TSY]|nr:carbohydrate ABC transporter permease [Chloroflexi bacterium TSY]